MLNYRILFMLLIAAINIFWGIGSTPLMDPDEPAYAETAKEMLIAGNYLSPKIFGDFWFDKPPMYYWLIIYSYKIFGINEFAARLPAALSGMGVILSLYYYARKFFNENIAFNAGIVLASCINFFYIGKAAVTDMTLLLFMGTALYAYLDEDYYLMYLCAALGTLTKGPIGIVFPVAIAGLHMMVTRNFKPLKDMRIYTGLLVYLAVAAPWYVMMYSEHGTVFTDTFFGLHNAARFASPEHPGRVVWYFYLPVLFLGLFPWINMFLGAVWSALTDNSRQKGKLWFFQCWWIFVFLFFSIAKTKLISYVFPMFPAICILIGFYIDKLDDRFRAINKWIIIAQTILFFSIFAIAIVFGANSLPAIATGGNLIAIYATITLILVSFSLYKNNIQAVLFTQVIFSVVIMFTLVSSVLPNVVKSFSVKELALNYKMHVSNFNRPLYVDKFLRPGFAFYTNEWGSEIVDKRNAAFNTDSKSSYLLTELMSKGDIIGSNIVLRRSLYQRLPDFQKQRLDILYESQDMLIVFIKM